MTEVKQMALLECYVKCYEWSLSRGNSTHYVNHYPCRYEPQLNIKTLTLRRAPEGWRGGGGFYTHTHTRTVHHLCKLVSKSVIS